MTRLPAAERRRTVLEAAARAFSASSFAGTTTAEIAREAKVSEPILYRHFGSKRELYLACVDEDWQRLRAAIEAEIEAEPDPEEWPLTVGRVVRRLHEKRALLVHFWIQALSEASGDPLIRRHMKRHMREVHAFFRDVLVRSRDAGGMPSDRDPDAEAWIMVGIGLVRSVSDRLGGLVPEEHFAAIGRSRGRWLTGRE